MERRVAERGIGEGGITSVPSEVLEAASLIQTPVKGGELG